MSVTGPSPDNPQRVGVPIGDLLAGMYGAYGVLAALLERERTGRGQVVRTSLLAAIVGVHALHGTAWTVAGQVGHAQGNHHPAIAPVRPVPLRRRQRAGGRGNESLWRRLCAEFGLDPEAPGMATNGERVENRQEVIDLVEGVVRHALRRRAAGPAGRGRHPRGQGAHLDEVYGWDQTLSQGLVIDVDHATLGPLKIPGPAAAVLRRRPGRRDRNHPARPPAAADAGRRRRRDPRLARGHPVSTAERTSARAAGEAGAARRPGSARVRARPRLLEVVGRAHPASRP